MPKTRSFLVHRAAAWSRRYLRSFSFVGAVLATLTFAISVTPSLLPRPFFVQGILSGFAIAVGYASGISLAWAWKFWELPMPGPAASRRAKIVAIIGVTPVFVFFLWQSTRYQNSIRERMDMPPLESGDPVFVLLIALSVAAILVGLMRCIIWATGRLAQWLQRFLPRRVSIALAALLVLIMIEVITNDLVIRRLLSVADRAFLAADEFIDPGIEPPLAADVCGGPGSLVPWDSIGRRGKEFIVKGPTKEELAVWSNDDVRRPVRVYVGMRSAEDETGRAELAVAELIRVGGFDRKVLVVATPTGTGWLDENGIEPIQFLHGGDIAIVSTQYSYLPSWMTILIEPRRAKRSAEALFDAVYDHWITLDDESRPRLYLFGLSLGAFGAETSADLYKTIEDPIQGAVFAGPPFPSVQWASIVANRNPDSPQWLPTYRDGSIVRFTSQVNHLNSGRRWGPIRQVYIQHASDPMIWFSPDLVWRRPDWMSLPRGPDVSPLLRWVPVVTFLQIAFDIPLATTAPIGYAHNYSASSYIDAWVAVTQPEGWTGERLRRFKDAMADRTLQP